MRGGPRPAAAIAAPTQDAEPNEKVFELTGPISRDGAIGTLAFETDVDEFLVQFQPAREVKLLFNLRGHSGRRAVRQRRARGRERVRGHRRQGHARRAGR